MSIMYYSDVKDEYGYANISEFPKDFDVKDIHEDLNVCEKCGDICNSHQEMYWQAIDFYDTYHECMGDTYDVVCDECFYKLSKE